MSDFDPRVIEAVFARHWPVEPELDLAPARRDWLPAQLAPAPVVRPRSGEVALYSQSAPAAAEMVYAEAALARAIGIKRAATGILVACCGLGAWFLGKGVHEIGDGIRDAGIGLWAVAAIFLANAASKVFAPRRGAMNISVRGHHNNVHL